MDAGTAATPRQALARLRAAAEDGCLDEVCERHGVAVLRAFGSAIRDTATSRDLDVAVGWQHGTRPDLLALWADLSELSGAGEDLDLLDLDVAGPVSRAQGLAGLPLYEARPQLYARQQIAALLEVMTPPGCAVSSWNAWRRNEPASVPARPCARTADRDRPLARRPGRARSGHR